MNLSKDTLYCRSQLGFGVYQLKECYEQVYTALLSGIRLIDSAISYRNERECERAIQDFCTNHPYVKRDEITLVTKIPDSLQGFDRTWKAVFQSLRRVDRPSLDMVLIHSPKWPERRTESWRALVKLKEEGFIQEIGVSNYNIHHLEEIAASKLPLPAVNQIELSTFNSRQEIQKYCSAHGIALMAFSPLTTGQRLDDNRLLDLAAKYKRTPSQILLRYCLERNISPIFKSEKLDHIVENANCKDFQMNSKDLAWMATWDEGFISKPSWNPIILP
ncbi:xylose and arabinose reductase [Schizosaccharomyces cryophilus OY26]|uniref:Xylose and arabinose reductase n=1 Tax=Schizosaccharomyces cryophilus (strain OY26 / ATCC MYA-4695 / CBS 11777 / NBRC 106824 / NRRL Y48691) TaxID=653667 RepID=S9VSL3_SCHCR|nr:xylose and arabinose reductase [Schizosaccharomyces cryophilus OY26]EPY49174.1 xylose and arabinose reductase [Schizosaccharomyces cryophilus OY26]